MGIIKKWNDTGIRLRCSGKDEEGIKAKPKRGIERETKTKRRERDTIYMIKLLKGIKVIESMFLFYIYIYPHPTNLCYQLQCNILSNTGHLRRYWHW